MSLNPLAPVFLPQPSFDPPISMCISTTMSLPSVQLFCGMPPQIVPSHAPAINQHITDGTFLLPILQATNQSKPNAAAHQPTPEYSTHLSSPLQHQANCLQAIHKTIQQFNQHLKAQQLDRHTLQLIVLQLQNAFAILRYLLFSDKDIAVTNSATSPLIKPNPNPIINPTSSAFPLPCTADPKLRRSTRWPLWDHPERKQTILQTPISNPHPTGRKLFQLRCSTSHQELASSNNCLPMK